jgi:glycine hydroxymethyltransferase
MSSDQPKHPITQEYYGPDFTALQNQDPEIAAVVISELERQRNGLQLIASENFTSPAVLAAMGSTLSNKYAEGYPGKRYYGGCEEVDKVEVIGIERAKQLFGAEHANLQPHSGASANVAVYQAFTKPGDTVLAMSLPHGGHLTHGSKVNFSGKWFNVVSYGVRQDNELIDYDQLRDLAIEHKPKMICSGATAYPSLIDFEKVRQICDEVGAIMWVDAAHFIGLVAGKAIPSPVPYADVVSFTTHKVLRGPRGGMILSKAQHATAIDKAVFPGMQGGPIMSAVAGKAIALKECATPAYQAYAKKVVENCQALANDLVSEGMRAVSGGTQTHLALIDIRSTGVTGKVADERCGNSGITLNKNAIPYDPETPAVTSGIRVATAATTTQGMGAAQMKQIASLIARAIKDGDDENKAKAIKAEVNQLCSAFPVYPVPAK